MIYIVTMYYEPLTNPAGNRYGTLVQGLVERFGADQVTVVTGRPNYPDGVMPDHLRGKCYHRSTGAHGETVINLYELPAPFKGTMRKALGMLTFTLSVTLYFLFKHIKAEDRMVIGVGPYFYAYTLFLLSHAKRRMPFIIDSRDLWPEHLVPMGVLQKESWVYRVMLRLSWKAYAKAERVVVNTPAFKPFLESEGLQTPVEVLVNPLDSSFFRPGEPEDVATHRATYPELYNGRINFISYGSWSLFSDHLTLLKALKKLQGQRSDWSFLFIGGGDVESEMRAFIQQENLAEQVRLIPHCSKEELLPYIQAADFGYASVIPDPMFDTMFPNKVPEMMACGLRLVTGLGACTVEYLNLDRSGPVVERGKVDAIFSGLLLALDEGAYTGPDLEARSRADLHCGAQAFKAAYANLLGDI